MADTTEIKKVITIDTGNSIQTLSDYKNRIDELKASLEQLDQTSDEYKNTIDEISGLQQQLNTIIDGGSESIDSLSSSYDNLSGKASKFKTGLDDIGDSTDTLNTNISDYSGAFNTAFDKMLDGVKNIDGPLGEVGGTVKNMIPVIRQVNSTAITGLSGIKKAIVSTGIGALVVALGLIVAHWDDIQKSISGAARKQERVNKLLSEGREYVETMSKEYRKITDEISFQSRLLEAQGADKITILNKEISRYEDLIKKLDSDNANLIKGIDEGNRMIAAGNAKALGDNWESMNERYNAYLDVRAKYFHTLVELQGDLAVETVRANTEAQKAAEEEIEARRKESEERSKARKSEIESEKKTAEELAETVRKNSLTELEALEEKYNEEKSILEKFNLDTTELTRQYEENKKKIILEQELEIQEVEDERYENIKNRLESEAEQLQFEAELQISDEQKLADAKYQIEQDLFEKKIALQQQYIEEYNGNQEGLIAAEEELDRLRQEYANRKRQYEKDSADYVKQKAKEEKDAKVQALTASLSVAGDIFGALSDLAEENSEEAKAFAIMQTTMDTLSGAIAAYKSMAGIPYVGPVLGVAAAAAVTAAGIANINKIRSTTKNSSGSSASVAAPQVTMPSMTEASPLLDEQADLNRLETSGVQGESSNTTNMRVYVVDQDIRDANHKAEVVEDNATF